MNLASPFGDGIGPASWADRLSGAIERGPIAEGVVYPVAAVVLFIVLTAGEWAAGSYPVGTFKPLHAVIAAGAPGFPWLIAIFNRGAIRAMERVRPLLAMSDDEASALTERLVRTPFAVDLGVAVVWLGLTLARVVVDPRPFENLDMHGDWPWASVGVVAIGLFILSISAYVVKIVHLTLAIRHVAGARLSVSLWELGPLNGFSVLTARIAGSLILVIVVLYTARPEALRDPFGLVAALAGIAIAAALFVVPLLGIHDRLVAEKARLRGEAARTMEASVEGLHAAIARRDLAAMDAHYKAVAAVEIELRTLVGIPTWPWMPDTFRWIVGALMFPIVLFMIQFVISKVLGG